MNLTDLRQPLQQTLDALSCAQQLPHLRPVTLLQQQHILHQPRTLQEMNLPTVDCLPVKQWLILWSTTGRNNPQTNPSPPPSSCTKHGLSGVTADSAAQIASHPVIARPAFNNTQILEFGLPPCPCSIITRSQLQQASPTQAHPCNPLPHFHLYPGYCPTLCCGLMLGAAGGCRSG